MRFGLTLGVTALQLLLYVTLIKGFMSFVTREETHCGVVKGSKEHSDFTLGLTYSTVHDSARGH